MASAIPMSPYTAPMATPLTTNCSTGPFPGVPRDDKNRHASHGASPDAIGIATSFGCRPEGVAQSLSGFLGQASRATLSRVASRHVTEAATNRSDITGMCAPPGRRQLRHAAFKEWSFLRVGREARGGGVALSVTKIA